MDRIRNKNKHSVMRKGMVGILRLRDFEIARMSIASTTSL